MLWRLVFLFFLSTALVPSVSSAADPSIRWRIIETPHFTVVYDSRHQPVAEQYARFAEQSFLITSPLFGEWPKKTVIVLDDHHDMANGFATGVPYPLISSYMTLPTALDSISDYGNWGLELLMHEYVHILTFQPATGVMRPFRWVFGSIVRPNILLPRWYTEGLAVELESRLSRFGRLRSANYLSIIRAMVEEGTLTGEDIARINEVSIPDWPGGIRPYLMGGLLWDEIVRQGGDGIIKDLNLAYSRRLPFFINGPLESRLGVDYAGLLAQVYARAEASARKQLTTIASVGVQKETRLQQRGYFSHSPVISPDGSKLAYIGKEHNIDSLVMMAERPPGGGSFIPAEARRLADGRLIGRVSWLPDSSALIYDALDTFERHYERSDLWRVRVSDKERVQLTHGLRAREPAVSPDGRAIVFSQLTPASTQLAAVASDGTGYRALYSPPLQTRVSRPEFISVDLVTFTEKRDDGQEVLKALRLKLDATGLPVAAGEPEVVLSDFRPVHFPRSTSEGLLFVSDRSGVANLYLADRDLKSARAVSNATTRIMTGELDAKTGDLIYSRLTAAGPRLFVSPREAWTKTPARLPQVAPLIDSLVDVQPEAPPKVETAIDHDDYSPLPYLWPRYWLPYAFVIPDGVYMQAMTSAADPVGRHAYALSVATDTLTNKPSFFGSYTNKTTQVPITLAGSDSYEYIYGGGFSRHSTAALASGSFYLPRLSNNWRAAGGWQYLQTDLGQGQVVRQGAQALLAWSNATRKGLEISPEKGGSFSVAHTRYLRGLGDLVYDQTDASGAYYFSKGLKERHAIAVSGNASIAPSLNNIFLGRSTVGGTYQSGLVQSSIVMRGYGSGVFIGRNLLTASLEYRFPLSYMYRGFGTAPFFVQRWHGDLFVDALTLDGVSYDFSRRSYRSEKLGRMFYGAGFEAKADATIFYHVPIQLIFGAYYGSDARANPYGVFPFIGLSL